MAYDCRLSRSWNHAFLSLLVFVGYLLCIVVAQNNTCGQGRFTCGAASEPRCINQSLVCDGYYDCLNGEDESTDAPCVNATRHECPRRNQTKCQDWDGRCYNNEYRCDGVSDCWGGIDERNCTYANCTSESFQCGVGLCVDSSKVCDGTRDCRDGSDEADKNCNPSLVCNLNSQLYCSGNRFSERCVDMAAFCDGSKTCDGETYATTQCDQNSCAIRPCEHFCDNLKVGYQCRCRQGYQLVNRTKCTDVNECLTTPHVCSQRCTNTVGNYTCSCAANYTLGANGRCIRSSGSPEPYLLFGNRYYIRKMDFNGTNQTRIPELHNFVHVIDIDDKTNTIFYVDLGAKTLNKMKIDGSGATVLDRYYFNKVEGIAVDWIGRKLYWTSTDLRGIYVSEMNGSFTAAVVKDTSSNCRGIAVHPTKGYVFWSDWSNYNAFIGRVGMDGTQETKIITTDIYWPNCVTVDYTTDRVFWVDAQTVRLEHSDLDGNNRLVLNVRLAHPYGVTVFEDYVFWSDWNLKSIHRADKFTGNHSMTLLSNLPIQPFDIKVYSPLRQAPGNNPCGPNNGGCSHLCLISPGGSTYKCACPQNMTLLSDQRTCNVSCSAAQFTCDQGDFRCIPWFFRCNGVAECINGEDELNCSRRVCSTATDFQCDTITRLDYLNCQSQYYVCDGENDCVLDGSDENRTLCEARVCQMWEFKCGVTGRCIHSSWQCDGRWHCPHGEDEKPRNPNCPNTTVCTKDQFKCDNGKCIDASWYCDVDDDCGDMSDEPSTCWQFREKNPCEAGFRRCPRNYRCIPGNRFCDGRNDCRDQADEQPEYCSCKTGDFTCDNYRCIPMRWRCDCHDDCGDGSDENRTVCASRYRPCSQAEFRCDECRCMSLALKCNGNKDCSDGTDEKNCTCPANTTFQCKHGAQCIDISLRCDGKQDCIGDRSDEENCTRSCASNEFRCNNSICISRAWLCDSHDDCGDGSDEVPQNCPTCPGDQFQCPQVRHCIPRIQVCDGVRQCEYGADELPPVCNDTCVSNTSFHCLNGKKCVHRPDVCNGQNDCEDNSDEQQCGGLCDQLRNHWCPQGCDSSYRPHKTDNYSCTCNEPGFEDFDDDGRNCIPETGGKGVLVHSSGRALYGYNMTNSASFKVVTTGVAVSVLDVDSSRSHVYWVDGMRMRRAILNGDDTLYAQPQDLCSVSNASGIAVDWIARNVYWTQLTGEIFVTSVKYACAKKLLYKNTTNFSPTSIVVNPNRKQLYFINSYYAMPSIMTLSTSGQPQPDILIGSELESPSDLTIDFNMGARLSWVDKHRNTIESCTADGRDRTIMFNQTRDRSPRRLDVFNGVIYWTTWSADKLLSTDQLGRGNTSAVLTEQTSIESLRFVHSLRYGESMTNKCEKSQCTMCLLSMSSVSGYQCVCPDGHSFYPNTYLCNIPSDDPKYAPLSEPLICSVSEYESRGSCMVRTTTTASTGAPTTPARTTVAPVSSAPSTPGPSSTTSKPLVPPISSSPRQSTPALATKSSPTSFAGSSATASVGTVPPSNESTAVVSMPMSSPQTATTSGGTSAAVIAVIVIILLLVIILVVVGVWAYRRGHFRRMRQMFKFRALEEDTAAIDQPSDGARPTYDRVVSFDGSNVDFGNPLYDEKVDTTPAYDKQQMADVAEVPSQNPYSTNGSLDAPTSVA